YRQGLAQAAAAGGATLEYRLRQPDGGLRWCRDEISLDGETVTGVLLDIDAERRARPDDAEIVRQRRAIIEQASHPIFLSDGDGRMTACNRAAQALLGTSCETVRGRDFA